MLLAEDMVLQREVAVKELHSPQGEVARRFAREVMIRRGCNTRRLSRYMTPGDLKILRDEAGAGWADPRKRHGGELRLLRKRTKRKRS